MKKLIPVFMAVILLLTGCAADGQRADGNGKVSGETASPMSDPAVNVDIGMYIYDNDWEPLSGITAELYADNTEPNTLKTAMLGQMLNYELKTEELIDISDIIRPLKVEAGGTVTLVTEHGLDMDNTIKYKIEV